MELINKTSAQIPYSQTAPPPSFIATTHTFLRWKGGIIRLRFQAVELNGIFSGLLKSVYFRFNLTSSWKSCRKGQKNEHMCKRCFSSQQLVGEYRSRFSEIPIGSPGTQWRHATIIIQNTNLSVHRFTDNSSFHPKCTAVINVWRHHYAELRKRTRTRHR